MDQEEWKAFTDYLVRTMGAMYDDVEPGEVVTWLLATWHLDKARPSRDEMLRFCLEHLVAGIKRDLPQCLNLSARLPHDRRSRGCSTAQWTTCSPM